MTKHERQISKILGRYTKAEAVEEFKETILPAIIEKEKQNGGRKDISMRCEAWNNYTDTLCKDGRITPKQYESWTNPF